MAKKTRTPKQRAATKRMIAANRKRNKGKKKRKPGPTDFQKFLMREGRNAKKLVPAWQK